MGSEMQPSQLANLTLQTLLIQQSVENGEFEQLEVMFSARQKLIDEVLADQEDGYSENELEQFRAADSELKSALDRAFQGSVSEINSMRTRQRGLKSYKAFATL